MADDTNSNEEVGRPLTPGEIADTRSVSGRLTDFSDVRVHDFVLLEEFPDRPQAYEGDIYFPPELYQDDFSKGSLDEAVLFQHEMTHILQEQLGIPQDARTPGEDDSHLYELDLTGNRGFLDFGAEQQAEINGNFFRLKNGTASEVAPELPPEVTETIRAEALPIYHDVMPFEAFGGERQRSPANVPVEDGPAADLENSGQQPSLAPNTPEVPVIADAGPDEPIAGVEGPEEEAPSAPGQSPQPRQPEPGPTLGDLAGDDRPQGGDNTGDPGEPPSQGPQIPSSDDALDELQAILEKGGEEDAGDDGEGEGEGDGEGEEDDGFDNSGGGDERPNPDAEPEPTGGTVKSPLDPDPNRTRPSPDDDGSETDDSPGERGPSSGGFGPNPQQIKPTEDGEFVEFDLDDREPRGGFGPDPNVIRPAEDGSIDIELDPSDRGLGGRPSLLDPNPHLVSDAGGLAAVDLDGFDFSEGGGEGLDFGEQDLLDSSFDATAFEDGNIAGFDDFDTLV